MDKCRVTFYWVTYGIKCNISFIWLLGYLVEIPQWERRRDRKHHWSTTQHLEQIRTTPTGIIHFQSDYVTSCDVTTNPVAILLPVMRNDTFYTNIIVRKKRGENDVTSGYVASVHVTSISVATSGHAQLCISYYCYVKKKSAGNPFQACAEHTSGYDVTSGHVTSCDVISGHGRLRWHRFQ